MKSWKVCHVTTAHKMADSRILFKECCGLAKAGFDVNLIVPHSHGCVESGVQIHALPLKRGRFQRIFSLRNNAFSRMLETRADLYHFHDPELIPLGLKIKKAFPDTKIIFDVHEFIGEQILNKAWLGPYCVRTLVSRLFKRYEHYSLSRYDGIVVAVPEMEPEYAPVSATVVIRNVPDLDLIARSNLTLGAQLRDASDMRLIYPGSISEGRGIVKLIEALHLLGSEYRLFLIGHWRDRDLRVRCESMPGWKQVDYLPQMMPAGVYQYMAASDIGVQLTQNTSHYQRGGFPVKVMEYMAVGLPVVLSDQQSKRNTFGDSVVYADPSCAEDIAQAIRAVSSCEKLKERLKQCGTSFVAVNNWKNESDKLSSFYGRILS